ncbi:Bcr/CflA family drug resistance efflux transporter [Thalassotalea insulae]|uniref:Bcr/CflA family efflux transporter n=1 Tax=Thalassotalea insulae TaxID=2056778 RepID=A0ABQ6GSN2_9GAMM|nr:multidrug effflux MFS transporter [Thalassotalea insulae]GLX78960.1 Bcr/CflA family drug resistance efflux transporter [Thalassotalea insulae]
MKSSDSIDLSNEQRKLPLAFLLPLLASIIAVSPLAIDMYLPAMPILAEQFNTEIPSVQNSLSVYLLGYALGLLFFGPLSDKFSRRKLVIVGLTGFALASFCLPFVSSINQFIGVRFIQAFISSAATVVVPGTIRERYGKNTAKGFSYVSMIMMLAPMVAPTMGSVLLLNSWQTIFFVLAGYSVIVLLLAMVYLPDVEHQLSSANISFIQRYKIVFAHKKARFDLITSMVVSLAFFAFITSISFVYIKVYQVSEFTFSMLFAINVLGLMTAHFINTRLVVRKGSRTMLSYGLIQALFAATCLVFVNYWQLPLVYTVISLLLLMPSLSMIAVNADALILLEFPQESGTATAVIGVLRFGIGSLAGPILAYFYDGSALPFAMLMWCAMLVVLLSQLMNKLTKEVNE